MLSTKRIWKSKAASGWWISRTIRFTSFRIPCLWIKTLSFEELQPHLYFNEKRPHTIPWVFKYYDRDWGFCLPKNIFDKLPRDKKYHAVIKSEFITDPQAGIQSRDRGRPPRRRTESRSGRDHRAGAYLSSHASQ